MNAFAFVAKTNWLLLAALIVCSVTGYLAVPAGANLPIHWNIAGEVDASAPAPLALAIAPAVGIATLLLFALLQSVGLKKDFDSGRNVIDAALGVTLLLMIGLEAVLIFIGGGGEADVPRLVTVGIAVLLMTVGNVLPKSQPNWVAGIRLPWTLRDEDNWRVTHRWTGRLMMLCGALLLIAALIVTPSAPGLLIMTVVTAVLPALAGVAISYAHAARKSG